MITIEDLEKYRDSDGILQLAGMDLRGANLEKANLGGANLYRADLNNIIGKDNGYSDKEILTYGMFIKLCKERSL